MISSSILVISFCVRVCFDGRLVIFLLRLQI
uniref:Uncharacterized protein n=1 Tax=Solanum lycopersicum TaxID=4081 RepID=A0A3Q7EXH5_SOLLC